MYAKSPDPPVRPCLSRRASPTESPAPPPRLMASPVLKDPYRKLPLNTKLPTTSPSARTTPPCVKTSTPASATFSPLSTSAANSTTPSSSSPPTTIAGASTSPTKPPSLVDLAATFLDYANVKKPATMDRRSLRPLLTGRTKVHRSHLVSALEEWRLAWDGRHKLIEGFDKEP